MSDTPRIYVASLRDYNAGILHGEWIDATDDMEDIWTQVHAMLAASPDVKQFPAGGPAEEFAIHDIDNFEGIEIGEYTPLEKVHKIATAIDALDETERIAFSMWIEHEDGDVDEPERFREQYRGHWDSAREFAEETVPEIGLAGIQGGHGQCPHCGSELPDVLEELENYIDWDKVVSEWEIGGAFSFYEPHRDPWGVFVFEPNA